jgi:hypothetical protein
VSGKTVSVFVWSQSAMGLGSFESCEIHQLLDVIA